MEFEKRPPVRKGIVLAKWLLILILTVLGAALLLYSRAEYDRYVDVSARAVTLTGEAYKIVEEEDSEGDTDYFIHVRYTYQGREYTTRYPETYGSRNRAEKLLGQMLEVTVNPDAPGEKISEIRSTVRMTAIISGLLLSIACSCLFIRQRKYWYEACGWQREYVLKDMKRKLRADWQKPVWLLTTGTWLIAVSFIYSAVFEGLMPLWGALVLVLGAMAVKKQLDYRSAFLREEYRFSRETLIRKEEDSDSDGTTYWLHYAGNQNAWREPVSRKKFLAAREGDLVEAVRFPEDKSPYLYSNRRAEVVEKINH